MWTRRRALAGLCATGAQTCPGGAHAQQSASREQASALDARDFGVRGDGRHDDSDAFTRWLGALAGSGRTGRLSAGHYKLETASPFEVRTSISIEGAGVDQVVLDGGARGSRAGGLFKLIRGRLRLGGLTTRNLMLIESFNALEADVEELSVCDWAWDNRQSPDPTRAIVVIAPYAQRQAAIRRLTLRGIRGRGGANGVSIHAAIETLVADDVEIGEIETPNVDRWFQRRTPGHMIGAGTANGLVLGDDDAQAQARARDWCIGSILVHGVVDRRLPRRSGRQANCDGVRLNGARLHFERIVVRGVTNATKRDCTGLYLKVDGAHGRECEIVDCGHHEASLVLKGAAGAERGGARGAGIAIDRVRIINREGFVGRPGLYLSAHDVSLGELHIEGCGGDVEDPQAPGERIEGASAVVRMSPALGGGALGELRVGRLSFRNCVLGGLSERYALSLGAYERIAIGEIECEGLSNAGRFVIGQSQPIAVVGHVAETAECRRVQLGRVRIRDCRADDKGVAAIVFAGRAPVEELSIEDLRVDGSVARGVEFRGRDALGRFQWRGGDVAALNMDRILMERTPALSLDIGSMRGFLEGEIDAPFLGPHATAQLLVPCRGARLGDDVTIEVIGAGGIEFEVLVVESDSVAVRLTNRNRAALPEGWRVRARARRRRG